MDDMHTDRLIAALVKDQRPSGPSPSRLLGLALPIAVLAAGAVFFLALSARSDLAHVADSARFMLKFVVAITLAASAVPAFLALSRPEPVARSTLVWLFAAPALLVVAVAAELVEVAPASWGAAWIGNNLVSCLTFIPLIGALPLGVLLWVLNNGAPSSPTLAGAIAGAMAGGVAATFYAAHCPDDSPLFVATWYSLAIVVLAAIGALAGRAWLRW